MAKEVDDLVGDLFRKEYGKIVAYLTSKFGIKFLDNSQDIAQDTLLSAITHWSANGIPKNPTAWLYTVAKNKAINSINKEKKNVRGNEVRAFENLFDYPNEINFDELLKDSMLKMMFVCSSDSLSFESQIVLMLSTLCGFSRKEIAKALLSEEESVKKKLYRAKKKLREENIKFDLPDITILKSRIKRVNNVLYLLFNEGYNSTSSDNLIRKDICLEALRLTKLLLSHFENSTSTRALLALMCFHVARFEGRVDNKGAIILFKEQNRDIWNNELIKIGVIELGKASEGKNLSSYHLEAGIAMEHCLAKSFEVTNWEKINTYYTELQKIKKSPIIDLNLAIIEGIRRSPQNAITLLEKLGDHKRISKYYLYHATLGEFYFQIRNMIKARHSLKLALNLVQNDHERLLIEEKLRKTYGN